MILYVPNIYCRMWLRGQRLFLNKVHSYQSDSNAYKFGLYHEVHESYLLYHLKLADNVFPYILYIFIVRTRMSAR